MNSSSSQTPTPLSKAESLPKADLLPKMRPWSQTPEEHIFSGGWRDWLFELPVMNRTLIISGAVLIGIGLLQLTVPPTYKAATLAVRPYTEAGRQEYCASNLKQLGLAVAQYSQDYDGHLPTLQFTKGNGTQGTSSGRSWLTALSPYIAGQQFFCKNSSNVADEQTGSSYGFNPGLAGTGSEQIANPQSVMLMTDRSSGHSLYLLPPLAPWNGGKSTASNESHNVAFVHGRPENSPSSYSANIHSSLVVYADGHVDSLVSEGSLSDLNFWGGGVVPEAAIKQVQGMHPALEKVAALLEEKPSVAALQKSNGKLWTQAKAAIPDIIALWSQNRQHRILGSDNDGFLSEGNYSEAIEDSAWRTALLWNNAGDKSFLQQLTQQQSQQMADELRSVQSGSWQKHDGELGFSFDLPASWNINLEQDGRYTRTYARSRVPNLFLMVEKGERSQMATRSTVDWEGMESDLRDRYGSRYQRVRMSSGMIGGQAASLWEFTLQSKEGPKLRKLYLGAVHPWQSYVVVCVAPDGESSKWKPVFSKMRGSFRFKGE